MLPQKFTTPGKFIVHEVSGATETNSAAAEATFVHGSANVSLGAMREYSRSIRRGSGTDTRAYRIESKRKEKLIIIFLL